MTLEELTKQVEDLQKELVTERKKISDQNSYITKLEAQVKNPQPGAPVPSTDPTIQAYIEKKMREDVTAQAIAAIKADVTEDIYKAVEPDFLEFLEKNMRKENVRVDYIVDAFALVWGRCMRKKDHPIHAVKTTTPGGTTPTNQNPIPGQMVPPVITQPPGITGREGGGTPPPSTDIKVANTKEAFAALKQKMGTIGGGKFS